MSETFRPHSQEQEQMVFSNAEETIAVTGTQFGKSHAGSLWLKRQTHEFIDPRDNFILCSPTYKILNQSALPYFLNVMKGMGEFKKVDAEFKMHHGSTVFIRTATEPDSIVGIPRVRAAWLDECGKYSLYFGENIRARLAAMKSRSLWTTSPYARNWFYRDKVKPIVDGKIKDIPLIQAPSWKNPYHALSDPVKLERERMLMDPRRFSMIYGGEFGRMSGLVYDCFDDDENVCDSFQLPTGTAFYAGIDWGFTEPFSMGIRGITPDQRHYKVSEFYKSGMPISDIITLARMQKQTWNIQMFYCGPDQPGYIEEFNRAGLPAIAADNDVRRGIDLHYELIKTRRFKLFRNRCPYTEDEIDQYHYPEPKDLGPDESIKDQKPVGQNDHALDADRYCTIMTYRTGQKHTPKVMSESSVPRKDESNQKRIARLKKMNRNKHTESW